ncbi:MAG TPA: hypothetical protein VFN56_00900 [Candidatus Saccharimonadales bacterium]|nr:hypothetical protein [Candidatus Saccharimonadales bacterium]
MAHESDGLKRPAWPSVLDPEQIKLVSIDGQPTPITQLEHLPLDREETCLEEAAYAVINYLSELGENDYPEVDDVPTPEKHILSALTQTVFSFCIKQPDFYAFRMPSRDSIIKLYQYATQVALNPFAYFNAVQAEATAHIDRMTKLAQLDDGEYVCEPDILVREVMNSLIVVHEQTIHFANV